MSAIFKRELKAYFSSPLGYIFLAVIYALSGYYFFYILANQANYIQYVFSSMFTVVMMIIPLLTMRLMSEDKKLKTDQLLLTSPVNITGIVVGKYLAAFVVYAVTVSRSLLNIILDSSILKWIGDRSYSIYLWHYPIIVLMSGGKRAAWWIVILEVVLSVGFAELSYRFIETPVRHGIIGEYIGIINSKPHNRRERHRQIQVARRSLKAMAAVLATGLALSLCIAFVPKKTTLDTVAKREKKATEVTKLTNQKLKEQKAKKTAKTSKSTMTDEELLKNVQMLLIGDSITVDVTDYFYKVLPNSISDTKIGRSTLTGVKVFDE